MMSAFMPTTGHANGSALRLLQLLSCLLENLAKAVHCMPPKSGACSANQSEAA